MTVRSIRADEYAAASSIMTVAFHGTRTEEPRNESGDAHLNHYGAFDEQDKMTACMVGGPFEINYFGGFVPMCGIGGVACLPEHRRGGQIRKLLSYVLQTAYERGDAFSALYPFDHGFYRKFGYELCCRRLQCVIPMSQLAHFPTVGSTEQYFPGGDDSAIRQIYQQFCHSINGACKRDDRLWKKRIEQDPYKTRIYTYVWRDESGVPSAYVTLTPDKHDGDPAYNIIDCAYVSPSALRGLLGFLRLMAPQGDSLLWRLQPGIDPFILFPDPYAVEAKWNTDGMFRVVNVLSCLQNRSYGLLDGQCTLQVTDDIIPQNNGTYRILFSKDGAQVERCEDDAPDARLSIQALTQLLLGANTVDEMRLNRTDVCFGDNVDVLRKAFPRQDVYLGEYF